MIYLYNNLQRNPADGQLTGGDLEMIKNCVRERLAYWQNQSVEENRTEPRGLPQQQVTAWSALLEKLESL